MAARCDELGVLLGAALRLCGRTLDGSMTCRVQRSAAHARRTAARSAEPGRRAQGCRQGVGARSGRAAERGGAGAAAGAGAAVQRAARPELHARAYRRSQRPAGAPCLTCCLCVVRSLQVQADCEYYRASMKRAAHQAPCWQALGWSEALWERVLAQSVTAARLRAGRAVVELTVERPDGSLAFVPADGGGPTATARLQLARPRARPRGVGGRELRAMRACAHWQGLLGPLNPLRPSLQHVCSRAGLIDREVTDAALGSRTNSLCTCRVGVRAVPRTPC